MSYHVDVIPNRSSPPAILFRQAKREGKRIRRTTLANLSKLPPEIVDGIRALLKGGQVYRPLGESLSIRRALPHGHVAALLGLARQLGLQRILHRKRSRHRDLALAAIVARVLQPLSKLATARALSPPTATSSLGPLLGLGPVRGNEMLAMLDWLLGRQVWIEKSLARRHLEGRTLLLYDVRRVISRDAPLPWRRSATTGTARRASRRSSSACCVPGTVVRWRWTCSRATRRIPPRWRRR